MPDAPLQEARNLLHTTVLHQCRTTDALNATHLIKIEYASHNNIKLTLLPFNVELKLD